MKAKKPLRKKSVRSPEQSKAKLVAAARKVFAARGYSGGTVKEIADEAGLNVCLISHYFDGKEGLYRAAIGGFGDERMEALARVLDLPRSREEFRLRLEMFVSEMLRFHLENAEVTTILLRDMAFESAAWGSGIQKSLFGFFTRMTEFFGSAREQGWMNPRVEPMIAAGVVYFTFAGLLQADAIAKRELGLSIEDEEVRRDLVGQSLQLIWEGLGTK